MFDLDSYLARIGYSGPRTPTLDTLAALHRLHPAAIPFENLNPLLGWPVPLDLGSLQAKMVHNRRGGWCFEHNHLFAAALRAMGFDVTTLAARVMWNSPPDARVGARSHMLLRVDLEGQAYIADVGFGGNVLTAPLLLQPDVEQTTPHEPHRLVPLDGGYVLELRIANEWKPLFRFTLEPQFPADYEVSSWHLCHHPSSFFRQMLLAARALPAERLALRNNVFTRHRAEGSQRRTLASAGELRSVLDEDFGLSVPDTGEVQAVLRKISESR